MLAVQMAELTAAVAAAGTQVYQLQDKLLQAEQVRDPAGSHSYTHQAMLFLLFQGPKR
jgi:hypothetical protein